MVREVELQPDPQLQDLLVEFDDVIVHEPSVDGYDLASLPTIPHVSTWEQLTPTEGRDRINPVSFSVLKNTRPKYFSNRVVPLAQQRRVELELKRMVETGVLYKVDDSKWASPIVVVSKPGGLSASAVTIRLP